MFINNTLECVRVKWNKTSVRREGVCRACVYIQLCKNNFYIPVINAYKRVFYIAPFYTILFHDVVQYKKRHNEGLYNFRLRLNDTAK